MTAWTQQSFLCCRWVPSEPAFTQAQGLVAWVKSQIVRVLVAVDDEFLGEALAGALRQGGYIVDLVADGRTALSYARFYDYSVAVLGWRMPVVPGLDVVRRLRRRGSGLPVLMLSGPTSARDRIAGLDAGADDFLVTPFDFGELLARLRALQRRPADMLPPKLVIGDLECDPAARMVRLGERQPALTTTELRILEVLMRCSPAVANRRLIAQQAWEDDIGPFGSNTIDVHLARLRGKLTGAQARIETVRGVGYRIVAA